MTKHQPIVMFTDQQQQHYNLLSTTSQHLENSFDEWTKRAEFSRLGGSSAFTNKQTQFKAKYVALVVKNGSLVLSVLKLEAYSKFKFSY